MNNRLRTLCIHSGFSAVVLAVYLHRPNVQGPSSDRLYVETPGQVQVNLSCRLPPNKLIFRVNHPYLMYVQDSPPSVHLSFIALFDQNFHHRARSRQCGAPEATSAGRPQAYFSMLAGDITTHLFCPTPMLPAPQQPPSLVGFAVIGQFPLHKSPLHPCGNHPRLSRPAGKRLSVPSNEPRKETVATSLDKFVVLEVTAGILMSSTDSGVLFAEASNELASVTVKCKT